MNKNKFSRNNHLILINTYIFLCIFIIFIALETPLNEGADGTQSAATNSSSQVEGNTQEDLMKKR